MMISRAILRCLAAGLLLLAVAGASPVQAAAPSPAGAVSLPDVVTPLLGAVVNIDVLTPATADPSADAKTAGTAAQIGQMQHKLGSGFIIDRAGYIVTNRHVVAGGCAVRVTLGDNRVLPASVLATNLYPDLALLKVDAGGPLPTVRLGDSSALRLGETVIAIGNPLGLSSSISVGVVSALNRNVQSTVIDDFIQTDASINHGNSGGPLFNSRGEMVGVNFAFISGAATTGSVGLGLAIPANDAAVVIASMRRFGKLNAGFPGMRVQALTPALAGSLGLTGTQGGIVTEVWPGAGAEKAGIQVGDVVLRIGREQMPDVRAMMRQMAKFPPGSIAPVQLWRAGRTFSVELPLTEFPPQFDPAGPPALADCGPRVTSPPLGLHLAALSGDTRQIFGVPASETGTVVKEVANNSAGAEAGLARGDVIERVQDAPVANPDEVIERLRQARAQGHATVLMLVHSQGRLQWMAVPVGEP